MSFDEVQGSPPSAAVKSAEASFERVRFNVLGSACEIHYRADSRRDGDDFIREATRWLRAFEARYSRFRPDSLISRINRAAGLDWVKLDAEAERMFALADQIFVLSRGVIDISILPLLRLWHGRPADQPVPDPEEVRGAAAKVGWPRVCREPGRIYLPETGMGLDLGGWGREFAVDRVVELAQAHQVAHVRMDLGNNVRVSGHFGDAESSFVGIADVDRTGRTALGVDLKQMAVSISGKGSRLLSLGGLPTGDIIDPRSGHPATGEVLFVAVLAGTCLEAGLLATTALILGPKEGLELIEGHVGAEGFVQGREGEWQTSGFLKFVRP